MTTVHTVEATSTTELLDALPPLARYGLAVPYHYGGEQRVLLNDPSAMHKVMSVPQRREGGFMDINRRVMGDGLLVTNALERWRPRRRLIQRELSPTRVRIYEQSIIDRTLATVRGWTVGSEISVRAEIGRLALDNLGDAVFGDDFSGFRDTVNRALELLVVAGGQIEAGVRDPELEAELESYIVRLEDVVVDLVGKRDDPDGLRNHVLDVLIEASRSGAEEFADPFVRDESITLMMAGHDTTAFLIGMAVFLLHKHPEAKQRLAEEVAAARADGIVAEQFATALPYARLVASEVLRLYPPLPFISRTCPEDMLVDGCSIGKGTTVTISPWITHRDARYFADPLAFDPDRFSAERRGEIPRNAYLPFGMGQRVCPGNHIAMLETAIITSIVAADVDLEFRSAEPQIDSPVTLRFAEPLNALVRAVR